MYDTPQQCGESSSPKLIGGTVTITQQLRERKTRLEKQLQDVNNALSAVEEHPEVETVLNLLAKAR